jgi:hypothetical protein
MTESERPDAALEALLRAGAPEPVADAGFVARTMAAVDQAARGLPARRRPAPVAPIVLARALATERLGEAHRARQWRWAIAGAIAGYFLMLVAMAVSPTGAAVDMPTPAHWTPLAVMMGLGAIWIAWRELRAG